MAPASHKEEELALQAASIWSGLTEAIVDPLESSTFPVDSTKEPPIPCKNDALSLPVGSFKCVNLEAFGKE